MMLSEAAGAEISLIGIIMAAPDSVTLVARGAGELLEGMLFA